MTRLYYLRINEAEIGPFTGRQLRTMWLTGAITVNTEWRLSGGHDWLEGKKLLAHVEGIRQLAQVRDDLRGGSAYPILRICLFIIFFLSLLGLIIFTLIAFLKPEDMPLAVTGIMGAIGSVFLAFILEILVDIADASLRKVD